MYDLTCGKLTFFKTERFKSWMISGTIGQRSKKPYGVNITFHPFLLRHGWIH